MRQRRSERPVLSPTHIALGIGAVASLGIAWLAWAAPLTFDEAFNRLYYGTFSAGHILRHYDRPNNHLLYTLIQSWLPQRLIAWSPWAVRITGVVVGSGLVFVALLVAARRGSLLVACGLIVGSPLVVTYLFVARGYGFSALFIVLSVVVPLALARRVGHARVVLASLLFALGIWPLPTNLFLVPGWLLGVVLIFGGIEALLGGVVLAVMLAGEYLPIEAGIRSASHKAWNGHPGVWTYFRDVTDGASTIPLCLVAASVVVVVAFAREQRFRSLADLRRAGRSAQLAVWCVLAAVSWFVAVLAADASGTSLPFVRNALPALWLLLVALVAATPSGRVNRLVALILLAPFVLGVVLWAHAGASGDWKPVADASRTDVLYATTPATIRDARSIHASLLDCSWWDRPVCILVAPRLAGEGIRVDLDDRPYVPNLPCALGSHRPPAPWQVIVYRGGRLLGQLCH